MIDPSEKALRARRGGRRRSHRSRSTAARSSTVQELTDGFGAEAIIDFVGEKGAIEDGIEMVRDGGFYYVIGYGENINIPTIDVIRREISLHRQPRRHLHRPGRADDAHRPGQGQLHTSTYPLDNDQRRDGRPRRRPPARPRHPHSRSRCVDSVTPGRTGAPRPWSTSMLDRAQPGRAVRVLAGAGVAGVARVRAGGDLEADAVAGREAVRDRPQLEARRARCRRRAARSGPARHGRARRRRSTRRRRRRRRRRARTRRSTARSRGRRARPHGPDRLECLVGSGSVV